MGPRNKNAKIASDPKSQKKLVGKSVKYIASGSAARYVCQVCNRSFKRGFFLEEGDKNACTRRCLTSLLPKEEVS